MTNARLVECEQRACNSCKELESKLDHAEKRCAALRLGLSSMTALVINHHAIKGPQDRFGFCETCTSESGKLLWEDHDEAWRVAKSSDCGVDYVHKSEVDKLKAALGKIRCIYCNAEYTKDQAKELADHILCCDKSPVVQLNKEIQSKAIDLIDLTKDEFIRICALTDNPEILGICARSQELIDQQYPVIKQRDDLQRQLNASKSEVDRLREALRKIADISQLTNVTFEVQAFAAADTAQAALKEYGK